MTATIGGASDGNRVGVQVKSVLIDNLPNETAQVLDLGVQVGKICLAPGFTEAARRIAEDCQAIADKGVGDVT